MDSAAKNGSVSVMLSTGLWLLVMAAALKLRPFLPVDETRYLAVAWEMWQGGNYLVPHLNGEAYSHKPPLLFWLINIGWYFFGVNDWWSRLVAPLFGLASLFLTARLAKRLWPEQGDVSALAPLILFGCIFWTLFTSLTMFDMILAFCALLGMLGIVRAWQKDSPGGLQLLALAIGIGALAKGPAILLTTLPVALLAPLWSGPMTDGSWSRGWKSWYLGVGAALLGGVAIGLLWAVPAAISGGEEYRNAIFWGQSAGRMVDSFAHAKPWWWFLATVPGLILPWFIWPAVWRSLAGLFTGGPDAGMRFCLAWLLPAVIAFSLISGKQFHYLLPIFPALALILARLLHKRAAAMPPEGEARWHASGLLLPAALFFILGLGIFALVGNGLIDNPPPWAARLDAPWGAGLMIASVGIYYMDRMTRTQSLFRRVAMLASLSAAAIITIHLVARPIMMQTFDLTPISKKLGEWERAGVPLAYLGKYHGQFHFKGRLKKPIAVVGQLAPDLDNWISANEYGRIIVVTENIHDGIEPVYSQPFRGRNLSVYEAVQVRDTPSIRNNP